MKFIISLEREGGHIVVLTVLLLLCIALSYVIPDNELVIKCGDLTLGALLLAMKGNGNGKPATPVAAANVPPPTPDKP